MPCFTLSKLLARVFRRQNMHSSEGHAHPACNCMKLILQRDYSDAEVYISCYKRQFHIEFKSLK